MQQLHEKERNNISKKRWKGGTEREREKNPRSSQGTTNELEKTFIMGSVRLCFGGPNP